MAELPQATSSPPGNFTRQVLIVLGLIALALFLWKISPVLMLFFAGVVMATAIHAGGTLLTRFTRLPPTFAVATVFLLLILLIVGGSYLFGKQVATQTEALWAAILDAWTKASGYVTSTSWGS